MPIFAGFNSADDVTRRERDDVSSGGVPDGAAAVDFVVVVVVVVMVVGITRTSVMCFLGKIKSSTRPPQFLTQLSPVKKLFPLPPHPPYLKIMEYEIMKGKIKKVNEEEGKKERE